jgi:hypothetical protein
MKSKRTRPRISHRAEKIIAALLEHPTQEKAAAAADVSTVTVWRYQRKPAFQKALLEARQAAFSQAEARLQQAATAAAVTVLRTMTDSAAPPAIRLRAAECVLDRSEQSLRQQVLEGRVSELERSAEAASRQVSGNPPAESIQAAGGKDLDVETVSKTN